MSYPSLIPLLAAILCAGAPALPLLAQAPPASQEDELLALLNTPVTTATRTAQASSKAPATMVTVTAEQILRRKYRSLNEVLHDLPEFKVDNGYSSENYNNVTVRGVSGQNKFVILMDGARIGAAGNEPLPIMENFPVHFAKQIEVVYGPASALYGADAFTGIINIVTWKEQEAADHASVRASFGNNQQSDLAAFWSGNLGSGTHFSVGAQNFSDDQPDMPKYYPDDYRGLAQYLATGVFPTAFGDKPVTIPYEKAYKQPIRANNVFVRLQKDTWTLSLLQGYTNVPSALTYTAANALPNPSSHVAVRTLAITANQLATLSEELSIQSTLTFRKYGIDPGSAFVNLFEPTIQPGYKYATSTSTRLEEVVNWHPNKVWTLTSGLSLESASAIPWSPDLATQVDESKSISGQGVLMSGAPFAADFYSVQSTARGLFVQGQMAPSEHWTFTLGARLDHDSRYGSCFNPRLGLVWTPSPATTLKVMFGSAFLAPSAYAAFRSYGNLFPAPDGKTYQSSYWHLPNPNLKPERAQTLETSLRTLLSPSLSLTVSVYRSVYKELETLMADASNGNHYGGYYKQWPVDFIEVTGNQGRVTTTGGNLQLDYLAHFGSDGKLNAFLSHSRVDGRVEDNLPYTTDMGNMTPVVTRLGCDLVLGRWSVSPTLLVVGGQRSSVLRQDQPTRREEVPGYRELNLAASVTLSPRWEAFLQIHNALDARYRALNEFAYLNSYEFKGVPQSPRQLALGLRVRL